MAKKDDFKKVVMERITAALGEDVIGIYDKKLYVWANVGGEKSQVAIALTVPNVQVEAVGVQSKKAAPGMIDFEEETSPILGVRNFTPAGFSQAEQDTINAIIKELGL